MKGRLGKKEYHRILFTMLCVVVVYFAVLLLVTKTTVGDVIIYEPAPLVTINCTYGPTGDIKILAEDAYRRDDVIYIKHPRKVFDIRDPNHKCTILQ